jgi:hypothetical protein
MAQILDDAGVSQVFASPKIGAQRVRHRQPG